MKNLTKRTTLSNALIEIENTLGDWYVTDKVGALYYAVVNLNFVETQEKSLKLCAKEKVDRLCCFLLIFLTDLTDSLRPLFLLF